MKVEFTDMLDLDAIEKRVKASTDGPWAWTNLGDKGGNAWAVGQFYDVNAPDTDSVVLLSGEVDRDVYDEESGDFKTSTDYLDIVAESGMGLSANQARPDDAAFIAACRTDVPALIAEVRMLRAELKKHTLCDQCTAVIFR